MNQQQATEFVVSQLGKHRQRNDIIQKLCERGELNWAEAEKFVRRIEAEHKGEIALKQSPLITLVGIGTILGGVALMGWVTVETLAGTIIFLGSFPIPYSGNLTYFFTGLVMVAGGVWGIWDTIARIWNG